MELLNELNDWVEFLEKNEVKKYYTPRKKTLEKILTNPFYNLTKLMYQQVRNYQCFKTFNVREFFYELTGIKPEMIRQMKEETRQQISQNIRKRLEDARDEIEENFEPFRICYSNRVEPIENRLKFVTEGKSTEEFIWLTKERRSEIHAKIVNFVMLHIDKLLELNEVKKQSIAMLALDIWLLEKPIPFLGQLITIENLKKMVDYKKEEEFELREKIKKWYQETNQTFIQKMIKEMTVETVRFSNVDELHYLFDEKELEIASTICMENIKKRYEELKQIKKIDRSLISQAKNLRREAKTILLWKEEKENCHEKA